VKRVGKGRVRGGRAMGQGRLLGTVVEGLLKYTWNDSKKIEPFLISV